MSDLFWPIDLPPLVDVQGFKKTLPDTRVRTQMDAGRPKVRRRFTAGVTKETVSLTVTAAQAVRLEQFFNIDTAGGTLEFDFSEPITQETVTIQFGENGPTLAAQSGVSFIYTFDIEILP